MTTRHSSGLRRPAGRGFTLAELLAVIGIMMVLVVGSFGVLAMVGQARGPAAALPVLQAMCNDARDHAITFRVNTRIKFSRPAVGTAAGVGPRTVMTLEVMDTGGAWNSLPDQAEVSLGDRIVVLNGLPSGLPADPKAGDYRSRMLTALRSQATSTTPFYLVFQANGAVSTTGNGSLAIVDLAADGQVTEYALYLLNVNTGTRMVFE
jgi:Tfp pilus assembly protein FimT